MAELYRAQGRYAEAEPLARRALALLEAAFGSHHPDVTKALNILALVHVAQGQHAAAEPLFLRVFASREGALGPGHPHVAVSLGDPPASIAHKAASMRPMPSTSARSRS